MLLKQNLGISILIQLSTAAVLPRQLDHAGEFAIVNCGTNTALVKTLLSELPGVLTRASQDAESAQSAAYQAFFKDPEQGASVSNLLAKIAQGAPVFPADQFTNGAPGFICVTGKGQLVGNLPDGTPGDGFDLCKDDIAALQMTGTKWTMLCPNFFTSPQIIDSPPAPPADNQPAPNCLRGGTTRLGSQFGGSPEDHHGAAQLVQFKVWILLHELVHSYINVAYGVGNSKTPALEIIDANAAFFLSAEDSVLNANSYVLYVASLYGKCVAFPILTGRKLLDATGDIATYESVAASYPAAVSYTQLMDVTVNVP